MYIRYNLKKVIKKVTTPQKKTRQKQIKNKTKKKNPAKYNENNPPNSQPLPKYLLSIK